MYGNIEPEVDVDHRIGLTVEQTFSNIRSSGVVLFVQGVDTSKLGVVVSQSIYRSSVELFPSVPRPRRVDPSEHRAASPARRNVANAATPNYARRRAVAAFVAAALAAVVVGFVILLAGLGGRPASAFQAEPAHSFAATVHVAEAGESLWSIAEDLHGDVSIERYVDALIGLNGGTAIDVGQAVRLP